MHLSYVLVGLLAAIFAPLLDSVSAIPSTHRRSLHFNKPSVRSVSVQSGQRFDYARMTWYDITVDTTACGKTYQSSDFVVAINEIQAGDQYPSPLCFKNIRIEVNGITADAQIVDKCEACPWGGLDLTEGLFQHFAPLSKGVLNGSWYYT